MMKRNEEQDSYLEKTKVARKPKREKSKVNLIPKVNANALMTMNGMTISKNERSKKHQ